MGNYSNKEGFIDNTRRNNIIDRAYVMCDDEKIVTKPDISKLNVGNNKHCKSMNTSFDENKGINSSCLRQNLFDILNMDLEITNEEDLKKLLDNKTNLSSYLDSKCSSESTNTLAGENLQVLSCDYRYPLELNNKLKCEIDELEKISEKIVEVPKKQNIKYYGIMGSILFILLIIMFVLIYVISM